MRRRRVAWIAVAVLALSASATFARNAAATVTVIAKESRLTSLSAYGDLLVWSRYDSRAKAYVLMQRRGGRTTRVPVASRVNSFDVDVGPGEGGGILAVYSRCKRETRLQHLGCRLFEYDFETRRESAIALKLAGGVSPHLPAIWKGRLVFASALGNRKGVAGFLPRLFEGRLSDPRSFREIKGGDRGVNSYDPDQGFLGGAGPQTLDLWADRTLFTWEREVRSCPGEDGGEDAVELTATQAWLRGPGSQRRKLGEGCIGGEPHDISSGALGPRAAYFVESSATSSSVVRIDVSTLSRTVVPDIPAGTRVLGLAVGDRMFGVLPIQASSRVQIVDLGPPQ